VPVLCIPCIVARTRLLRPGGQDQLAMVGPARATTKAQELMGAL
jgi:hypothetical protein